MHQRKRCLHVVVTVDDVRPERNVLELVYDSNTVFSDLIGDSSQTG
jgi:hypothetical protein